MKSVLKKMQVHIIPVFSDNYSYLIVDQKTNEAAIVDPAEPTKIIPALEELSKNFNFKLSKILTTHKHWV
jgi:hydroxyacylglutathione hydrolase